MASLPETTLHRLQRIPQVPSVWEGDRLPIQGVMDNLEPEIAENSDCIIWLDGSEGFVRSMDIVRASIGQEAVVRALLKAMESPHNPAQPCRPQKIIVKDRELQFFLRGVLQDLDIVVDYQPELPLLDELWVNFQNAQPPRDNNISHKLASALHDIAISLIWERQPWQFLSEEEIIKIEINHWNIESLYACVMGMLEQEFGIILYRSLDSLKNFRQRVMHMSDSEEEELENTFLQQDCWFLNFDEQEIETPPFHRRKPKGEVSAIFGSIHPYEGIRSLKEEEEVYPIYTALKALGLFIQDHEKLLMVDDIGFIKKDYTIDSLQDQSSITVSVSTMPELTAELESAFDDDDNDDDNDDDYEDFFFDDETPIYDDLIPEGTLISFLALGGDFMSFLDNKSSATIPPEAIASIQEKAATEKFPAVILQTTRPKAKQLIESIEQEGGIELITFTEGYDPYEEEGYYLGILETGDENRYVFSQFPKSKGKKREKNWGLVIENWTKQVEKFDGYCGILIAMGASGASRGNPQPKDLLYFFYCRFTDADTAL